MCRNGENQTCWGWRTMSLWRMKTTLSSKRAITHFRSWGRRSKDPLAGCAGSESFSLAAAISLSGRITFVYCPLGPHWRWLWEDVLTGAVPLRHHGSVYIVSEVSGLSQGGGIPKGLSHLRSQSGHRIPCKTRRYLVTVR